MSRPMNTEQRAHIEAPRNNLERHRGQMPEEWQDFILEQVSALSFALSPPASAGEGFVVVPRDALQTEARRLRYRADECGLPGRTDAGNQMAATAKQLEAWAAPTPPATAQEDGKDAVVTIDAEDYLHALDMLWQAHGGDNNYPLYRRFADFLPQATADAAMLTSPDSGKEG